MRPACCANWFDLAIDSKGVFISAETNGAYLSDIVLILKNQWPRKHTENTEYSQIISVSSVDSVAIYHDFDLSAINRSDAKDAEEVSDVRTGGIPYADSRTILVWHGRALV